VGITAQRPPFDDLMDIIQSFMDLIIEYTKTFSGFGDFMSTADVWDAIPLAFTNMMIDFAEYRLWSNHPSSDECITLLRISQVAYDAFKESSLLSMEE